MNCPTCGSDLIKSKVGKLCLNCGDVFKGQVPVAKKSAESKKVAAKPKTVKKITVNAKKPRGPVADDAPIPHIPEGDYQPEKHSIPVTQLAELSPPPTKTIQRPSRLRLIFGIGVVILLVGALIGGYWWYMSGAASRLTTKLTNAKTLAYAGSINFAGKDFLSIFNSQVSFSGAADFKNGASIGTQFKGKVATKDYDGQSVVKDGKWYLKLAGNDLPTLRYKQSSYLYRLTPDWQRFDIDKDLFNNYCEVRADQANPNALEVYRIIKELKVRPDILQWPLGMVKNQLAIHNAGNIDSKNLPDLITRLNAQLPPTCGWSYSSEDAKDYDIRYDYWTAPAGDSLQLVIQDKTLGTKFTLALSMSDYGKPQLITAPAAATDISALRRTQMQILAHDDKRKENIEAILTALGDYKTDNGKYPITLKDLAPKYLKVVPTDPSGTNYVYSTTAARSKYSILAHLEEPNAGDYERTSL